MKVENPLLDEICKNIENIVHRRLMQWHNFNFVEWDDLKFKFNLKIVFVEKLTRWVSVMANDFCHILFDGQFIRMVEL